MEQFQTWRSAWLVKSGFNDDGTEGFTRDELNNLIESVQGRNNKEE